MTSHDETHPRSDLDIVRSGDLWSCHMLEVQSIAHNLSIDIGGMSKKAAIRFVERNVASGAFAIRERGKSLDELVAEIGLNKDGFLKSVSEYMEGGS